MNDEILEILKVMGREEPAKIEMIENVEREWNVNLPSEYKELMLFTNGVEGAIGDEEYLAIWPINEIIELNQDYAVDEFIPGIKYFGSDGADMAYGFEFIENEATIIEIPFGSIDKDDAITYGESIFEFIIKKSKS